MDEIYVSSSDINTGNSCKATFIKKVSYNSFQKTPVARSEKSVTEIGRPHDTKTKKTTFIFSDLSQMLSFDALK